MSILHGAPKSDLARDAQVLARCPYLANADVAWVAKTATLDHRCQAVDPPAPLALSKQRRLCLTANHAGCATYVAARAAHDAGVGSSIAANTWGWVRTTPVVDVSVGRGALVADFLADRRGWQVVPAIALVAALGALGISNFGSSVTSARATPSSIPAALASPSAGASPASSASSRPSASPTGSPSVPPSPVATVAPSPSPSPSPAPSSTPRALYTVVSGDTLYGIAAQFNVTVPVLMNFNGLTTTNLRIGQVLKIP